MLTRHECLAAEQRRQQLLADVNHDQMTRNQSRKDHHRVPRVTGGARNLSRWACGLALWLFGSRGNHVNTANERHSQIIVIGMAPRRAQHHDQAASNATRFPTLTLIDSARSDGELPLTEYLDALHLERRARTLVAEYWSEHTLLTGAISESALATIRAALDNEHQARLTTLNVIVSEPEVLTVVEPFPPTLVNGTTSSVASAE